MVAAPGNCYNPNGPSKKPIDWAQFEALCGLQCTQDEIASVFRIHRDTLRDNAIEHYEQDYSTIYKRFAESGKASLRRNQFVLSRKNAATAIWLGKQWLGQKDTEDKHIPPNDGNLTVTLELIKENAKIREQLEGIQKELSKLKSNDSIPEMEELNHLMEDMNLDKFMGEIPDEVEEE